MSATTDQAVYDFLAAAVTIIAVAYGLYLLLTFLRRRRSDLSIGAPIAVAFGLRILAAVALTSTGFGSTLRGGDETFFLEGAVRISSATIGNELWTDALTGELFKFVFASQLFALDPPELALRVTQGGIAVAGLALLAVAVYELAGPRAALISAWVLALEPTNVFFSTLLHKEPNMLLAGGLVALGGATLWKRGDLRPLLPIALGCLIAVATRPYAGWFLIAAGAAIALHAGIRSRGEGSSRPLTLIAVVVLFGAVAAPTIWEASTEENLDLRVQQSQDANASDDSNLSLERVDFSTREAIVLNLPQRMRDVLLRPYPWQLGNTSQQLGLIGSLFAFVVFAMLIRELLLSRGRLMARAGPLVYIGLMLLIAYALSAGNAGTGFRYRMHVVALAVCLLVVLWALRERATAPSAVAEEVRISGPPPDTQPLRA